MRRPFFIALFAPLALVAAACGPTTSTTTLPTTTTVSTTTTSESEATTTTTAPTTTSTTAPTTTTEAAVGEFRTGTYTSAGFPGSGSTVFLEEVTIEPHEGFDRVVFSFDSPTGDLTFEIGPVTPPVLESPSGRELDVAGDVFIEVVMTPASGFEFVDDDVVETYRGDARLAPPTDAAALAEVVRTEDFENVMTWVLGVDGDGAHAHRLDPTAGQLIVDIRSP